MRQEVWMQATQIAMNTLERFQEETRKRKKGDWRIGDLPDERWKQNGAAEVWNALIKEAANG